MLKESQPSLPHGDGGSPHSSRRRSSPWASIVRGDSEQSPSPPIITATAAASPTVTVTSSTSPPTAAVGPPGPSSTPITEMEQTGTPDNSITEVSGSEPQLESSNSDVHGEEYSPIIPRRPAWNRPHNGVVEPPSVIGGTASWPALSEVRAVSFTRLPDIPTPQPVFDGSAASLQAPLISQPPQRPTTNNDHVNNFTGNNYRRSRNRGGSSSSGPSHNPFNQPAPPMPPPFPVPYPMIPAPAAAPIVDNSVRGARPNGGIGSSQSHTGHDHSSQRNNSRRGGYGPRPRGDGPYHNNHGGRRDQDRRDVHPPPPPQYIPPNMGYMQPPPLPPGAVPYMSPMRMYAGPQMGFDMTHLFYVPQMAPDSFRPMSLVPMIFPHHLVNENLLTPMILKQFDFYFSNDNLAKDKYLKNNMDDQGWVPIALVANFPRVQQLTKDIPLILDSLRYSTIVEVQGDKIRRRGDWSKYVSSSRTPNLSSENVLTSSREDSLDDATNSNGNGNGDVTPTTK